MKRSLLLIPLILLALWAGTTWIIGSYTQSGFDIALEKANQQLAATPANASISQESYSRGFLSSQAITKISRLGKANSEKNEVFLKFQAWHGPLMFTPKGFKLGNQYVIVTLAKDQLSDELRKKIETGFKGKEAFQIAFFSAFDGNVDVEAEISPFSSDEKSNTSLQFEGLTALTSTDHQGSFAKGSFKFGALTVADKKSGDTLSVAAGDSELHYTSIIPKVAADGSSRLDLPEIKFTSKGGTYSFKKLHLESDSKQAQGKLNVISKISLGEFKGPEQGPFAEIASKMNGALDMEFSSEGLAIETLKEMADSQKKLSQVNSDTESSVEEKKQVLQDYLVSASSLLQPDYKMKNHIIFTNQDGKSELALGLEYTSEKNLIDLTSFQELLEAFEIALNLRIAKNLIPVDAAAKIQPAIAMGFILDINNFYKSDALLAKGELTVNDKPHAILKNMAPMLNTPIPWGKLGVKKTK